MRRYPPVILLWSLALLLSSCFKEDEPVTPHQPGTAATDTIPMTYNYKYQVYFALDSGIIVSMNPKTESDLGFECGPQGWEIILNTADFMRAADLGAVPFGVAHDTIGLHWKFDKSDGNPDSLAFGVWYKIEDGDTISDGHVYAIDRGYDENTNPLGLYQVIFDSLAGGKYYFKYAPLGGGNIISGVVPKNGSVNYAWYSLSGGGSVKNLEPPKETYDLLFTQYTTLLFTDEGEPYPYLVTGVLSNRNDITVATDTLNEFSSITFQQAQSMLYSSALDAIGYEWKSYNFESGAYTVKSNITYIIHNSRGLYYKMRFIGFYNKSGEKGYPVIEHQQL
jgi:hypothetical protein